MIVDFHHIAIEAMKALIIRGEYFRTDEQLAEKAYSIAEAMYKEARKHK